MTKIEAGNLYFLSFSHNYKWQENKLVRVLELTHETSPRKRCWVECHTPEFSTKFNTDRSKLVEPIKLNSAVEFMIYKNGFDYKVKARATFYKHPAQKWVDASTPYIIDELFVNDMEVPNIKTIADYISTDEPTLRNEIHKALMFYVDELPFFP